MILSMENISKVYGGKTVLDRVSLTIEDTDRIGLVGENGCGKSTLLRIITGNEEYELLPEPNVPSLSVSKNATVGYLAQNTGLSRESRVFEEMQSVFSEVYAIGEKMRELEKRISREENDDALEALSREYSLRTAEYEAKEGYLTEVKIKKILGGMGFGEAYYERVISTLSGGEKTRLAIAKLLLEEPSLLILDEPTNHLDFGTILWLEDYLSAYKGALLIVSHDRYFLDKLCTSVCDFERGHLRRWKGNYTKYTALRAADDEYRLKEYEAQTEKIKKLSDFVDRNLVRATTSTMAKSKRKAMEKLEENLIEKPVTSRKTAKLSFEYDIEPPLDVLEVKGVDMHAGDRELARNVGFTLRRGDKVGIVGDNGTGKSTLLKILLGRLPSNGNIFKNKNVKISYFDQENTQLHPELTLIDEVHDRYRGMTDGEVRSLLGLVGLTGENVFKEVGVVSGGERAKLCFALMMLERGNVLVLDEPTNHLDIDTRESLEDALEGYTGTIMLVSHDRYLLNRVCDRIFEVTPESVNIYDCSFDEYTERRKTRIQQQAAPPKEKAVTENAGNYYQGKKQRSENAKRRARIRELEKLIHENELHISALEREMADPETASDFELMEQKCAEYEKLKGETTAMTDEWLELSEEDENT